jgi:hypothetical protein
MSAVRSPAEKVLETVAHERCPCGHLRQRHRTPTSDIEGEVMGACRDCSCRGLIDWTDDDEARA